MIILSLSISCLESKPSFIRHHRYLHRFVLKLEAWFRVSIICQYFSCSVCPARFKCNATQQHDTLRRGPAAMVLSRLLKGVGPPPPHVTNPVCVWSMKKSAFPARSRSTHEFGSAGRLQMWLPSMFSSSTDLFIPPIAAPPVTITTSE